MALLNKGKEEQLFVSCEIGDGVRDKIKEVRKYRGKRTGWILKEAIRRYLAGEIEL